MKDFIENEDVSTSTNKEVQVLGRDNQYFKFRFTQESEGVINCDLIESDKTFTFTADSFDDAKIAAQRIVKYL